LSIELKEIRCEKCGGNNFTLIRLADDFSILECKFCHTRYEFRRLVAVFPRLIFERGMREPFVFELRESVSIGREPEHNYVLIRPEFGGEQNTYIRNPYVSRNHVRIEVRDEYAIKGTTITKKIYATKKCLIKDSGSSFGTTVNSKLLGPSEIKPLNHNDQITLSPNSPMPLKILFKEA